MDNIGQYGVRIPGPPKQKEYCSPAFKEQEPYKGNCIETCKPEICQEQRLRQYLRLSEVGEPSFYAAKKSCCHDCSVVALTAVICIAVCVALWIGFVIGQHSAPPRRRRCCAADHCRADHCRADHCSDDHCSAPCSEQPYTTGKTFLNKQ